MINFEYVEFSNYLSTGATPVRFHLNKDKSTIIYGNNGAGKSTIISALMYGLFNKGLRDVKLPQLVNSVNKKKCLVTVAFTTNGKHYIVNRGMKPSIFTIEVDGEMMNEDAATKDLQAKLESILGCDFKTFLQTSVLSSSNMKYFMELTTQERRSVVETMLDIEVVGSMNAIMKDRVKEVNSNVIQNSHKIEVCENKISSLNELISSINEVSEDQIKVVEGAIESNNVELLEFEKQLKTIKSIQLEYPDKGVYPEYPVQASVELPSEPKLPTEPKLPEHPLPIEVELPSEPKMPIVDVDSINAKLADINTNITLAISTATTQQEVGKFYQDNDNCDRCKQPIDEDFKNTILHECNAKIDVAKQSHSELVDARKLLEDELNVYHEAHTKFANWRRVVDNLNTDNDFANINANNEWKNKCENIQHNHKYEVDGILNIWKSECNKLTSDNKYEYDNLLSSYHYEKDKIDSDYNNEVGKINSTHDNKIIVIEHSVAQSRKSLDEYTNQMASLMNNKSNDSKSYHDELKVETRGHTGLLVERSELTELTELCTLSTMMLKDNGLKAKIVEQYLPTINGNINKYLDLMGANYSFVLDDKFDETIKSRYRDSFSYGSFSNGERSRINFAILLMWISLAKSKNTVSTNILLIDEVLDGCLDSEGIYAIMGLFDQMENTNIFCISHRKEIGSHFDAEINVCKVGNYSSYNFNNEIS